MFAGIKGKTGAKIFPTVITSCFSLHASWKFNLENDILKYFYANFDLLGLLRAEAALLRWGGRAVTSFCFLRRRRRRPSSCVCPSRRGSIRVADIRGRRRGWGPQSGWRPAPRWHTTVCDLTSTDTVLVTWRSGWWAHGGLRKWLKGEERSQLCFRLLLRFETQGVHSLLVMWDTFSSFFRTESMREDVCSISSPKSPNMLKDKHHCF